MGGPDRGSVARCVPRDRAVEAARGRGSPGGPHRPGPGVGGAVGALGRAGVVVEARVVIVLGIDTATRQTSVALGTERGPTAQMALSVARSHEEIVAPAIQQLLTWSDTSLSQLGGVAVGIGPGLFTGLRVGVETARTLAQVLAAPIVGIPSLDGLAVPVRD